MPPSISFKHYRRTFTRPLQTAYGKWLVREGFLVRFEDCGHVGYGEVVPIPEFGTETVEEAAAFLKEISCCPDREVPEAFPCCASAFSCARMTSCLPARSYEVAALLPTGEAAFAAAIQKEKLGYRTFKWKLGVKELSQEQGIFSAIAENMPKGVLFRLDANGAWSMKAFESWLSFLQPFRGRIEWIEQPLPAGDESTIARCSEGSGLSAALDESLVGPNGLRWLEEWKGPLVVKPLLMGNCGSLLERLRPIADRVVLSSVFETAIGLLNVLRLADALPEMGHAIGFDTLNFSDGLSGLNSSAFLRVEDRVKIDPEALWKQLPQSI